MESSERLLLSHGRVALGQWSDFSYCWLEFSDRQKCTVAPSFSQGEKVKVGLRDCIRFFLMMQCSDAHAAVHQGQMDEEPSELSLPIAHPPTADGYVCIKNPVGSECAQATEVDE